MKRNVVLLAVLCSSAAVWEPAWFQTDEVYIDYTADGYYLYNRRHPGTGIAFSTSF